MSTEGRSPDSCERRLQVLASGIAHELGNCMVGVISNAEMLAHSLPLDGAEAAMVQDVLRAGERAAELAREMREYAGKSPVELRVVTIEELVHGIRDVSLAGSTRLRVDVDGDLPPVRGDCSQLRRVLTNLLLNAEEALDGKSHEIVLRARLAPVTRGELLHDHLPPTATGKLVHLEVQDAGMGMSPDTLRRIFDPFSTSKPAARGIGLAIVLGIVRAHRGGIRVQSAPAQGATFSIVLPSHEQASTLVLVVDDEPLVRNGLRRILQQQGYTVVEAVDGPSGLALVDKHPELRAVVLDVIMPGMSGLEVLEEIRLRRPNLPVLVSSACAELPPQVGDGLLAKPYSARQLLGALEALLASSR